MSVGTLEVTISVGDSWQKLVDSMRRLRDAFVDMGVRLGLPDPRAERNYRRKQRGLRAHVMRVNSGNRRRQRR